VVARVSLEPQARLTSRINRLESTVCVELAHDAIGSNQAPTHRLVDQDIPNSKRRIVATLVIQDVRVASASLVVYDRADVATLLDARIDAGHPAVAECASSRVAAVVGAQHFQAQAAANGH
jgi:hypothetical protein